MSNTKVITGKCRLSYVNIFQPKSINGSDPKYSVSVLINKKDKETLEKIEKAIKAAEELGKASKWGGKIPKNLKRPLRDGDEAGMEPAGEIWSVVTVSPKRASIFAPFISWSLPVSRPMPSKQVGILT